MKIGKTFLMGGLVITAILIAPTASSSLIFTGSSGNLSASAAFSVVNGQLQVVLTNTATVAANARDDVLTPVFFWLPYDVQLGRASARLTDGSDKVLVRNNDGTWSQAPANFVANIGGVAPYGTFADNDVGAEWAYNEGITNGSPWDALYPWVNPYTNRGISSIGAGLFGPDDRFDTVNDLYNPPSPDGLQYGILPDAGAGNGNSLKNAGPLISNSVTFLFNVPTWLDDAYLAANLHNVWFQYGTSLSDPSVPGIPPDEPPWRTPPLPPVPEPATAFLVGLSLLGLVARKRWMS